MLFLPTLALLSSVISTVRALTVYGQIPLVHTMAVADATATATSGAPPVQTTLAAYDMTQLQPPAPPSPNPGAAAYTMSLQRSAAAVPGLSIPHVGAGFWGFSIEMSVISQVCAYICVVCAWAPI
jgi:hypothetical protein